MPYNVCCLDQPFFLKDRNIAISNKDYYPHHATGYNLSYLIQKYQSLPLSYPQWIVKKEFLDGGESVVQLGPFSQYFGTCVFEHLNHFKQIQVIGETKESSLKIKAKIKSTFPSVYFSKNLNLEIKYHSVDIVHTIVCSELDRKKRENMLPEILSLLNHTGKFYLTYIVEDYDIAIHKLCKEFSDSYIINKEEAIGFEQTTHYFSDYFASVEIDEFTSEIRLTDLEDIMVHILSDSKYWQLKLLIANSGLSKFRMFLKAKIELEGAIILKRHIKLLTCKKQGYL